MKPNSTTIELIGFIAKDTQYNRYSILFSQKMSKIQAIAYLFDIDPHSRLKWNASEKSKRFLLIS